MRTRYAIIDIVRACEAGLDTSVLRVVDGGRVIITEAQAEGIKGAELLGKDEVNNVINKKSK